MYFPVYVRWKCLNSAGLNTVKDSENIKSKLQAYIKAVQIGSISKSNIKLQSMTKIVLLGIVFAVLNPCLKRRKTPKGVVFVDGDGTGETGRQNRKQVFQQCLRILCAM